MIIFILNDDPTQKLKVITACSGDGIKAFLPLSGYATQRHAKTLTYYMGFCNRECCYFRTRKWNDAKPWSRNLMKSSKLLRRAKNTSMISMVVDLIHAFSWTHLILSILQIISRSASTDIASNQTNSPVNFVNAGKSSPNGPTDI